MALSVIEAPLSLLVRPSVPAAERRAALDIVLTCTLFFTQSPPFASRFAVVAVVLLRDVFADFKEPNAQIHDLVLWLGPHLTNADNDVVRLHGMRDCACIRSTR